MRGTKEEEELMLLCPMIKIVLAMSLLHRYPWIEMIKLLHAFLTCDVVLNLKIHAWSIYSR